MLFREDPLGYRRRRRMAVRTLSRERPPYRTYSHSGTVTERVIRLRIIGMNPLTEHPSVAATGITVAPVVKAVLVRVTFKYSVCDCYSADGVVSKCAPLWEELEVVVESVVELVGAAYDVADDGAKHDVTFFSFNIAILQTVTLKSEEAFMEYSLQIETGNVVVIFLIDIASNGFFLFLSCY